VSEIVLSDEARKAISRWTRDEFYVYIRPLTSRLINRSKPHKIYWQVSVEYRYVEFKMRRGEGYDLNEVILTLDKEVPRRKDAQPGYLGVQEKPAGETGKKSKKKKVAQYESEAKEMTGKPREDKKKSKKKKSKVADVIPIDRPRKRPKDKPAKKKTKSKA
jgi:hypothetical protein